ncbi:MAG: translation initiation factor IF-2 [Eubacteriaceae bacterium]|jgi:translation initiation factor IF-2|nr:translation initiation factor IF-2 [Eubacteriaceae bacterium]
MTKKVYELAKEFGVQSKEFANMLQEINIPIKNHMSVITDQQEKYFRNNFAVSAGRIVPNSEKGAQPKAETPPPEAQKPREQRAAEQTRPTDEKRSPAKSETVQESQPKPSAAPHPAEQAQAPRQQGAGQPSGTGQRPPRNASSATQREGQNRMGTGSSQPREYQRQPGQGGDRSRAGSQTPRQGSYGQGGERRPSGDSREQRPGSQRQGPASSQRPGGQRQGSYAGQGAQRPGSSQGSRPGGAPANRQGSYQGRQGQGSYGQSRPGGQGGYSQRPGQRPGGGTQPGARGQQRPWDKDADSSQRGFAGAKPAAKKPGAPATNLEKPKIDKNKKESKQKNEQRSKARESFFNDDRQKRTLDNTKKVKGSKSSYKKKKLEAREERMNSGIDGAVTIAETVTISELSEKIHIQPTEILKVLMSYGMMLSLNQSVDFETAQIACEELGIAVVLEEEADIAELMLEEQLGEPEALSKRAPIITVMGHVDHGKTSLLDAIRNTHVTAGESGGITQHIGAYTISAHGEQITFIDTPGHEAFTAMRSRGASVTDIAVLVIAADDGIKPQTVEAINHAKAAEVPILVAINKVDKPEANPERVMQELTEYALVPEEWGGDTICIHVSAKTGQGIDELLDSILLLAEVEDLKANFSARAVGTVIEARIDKQRGVTASLLIKSGTLRDSDFVVAGTFYGKVRLINNDMGARITEAEPSRAVEILGFEEVPEAGDKFFVAESEKEARSVTDKRRDRIRILAAKNSVPTTFDELFAMINENNVKEVKLILKADVSGSYEAVKQALERLNNNDLGIKVNIIHGGVGAVTESDINLASASSALLLAYNVKADQNAQALAQKEGVEIRSYEVIYALTDDIEKAMNGLRDPEYKEVITAEAEVRQTFKVPNIGFIAGCYVTSGTVHRRDKARVKRSGKVIFEGSISSLKRFKDDVREVSFGYECGVGLDKFADFSEGDALEFYKMEEIAFS